MKKSVILKICILFVFIAAIAVSAFTIRIKTKEACATDIFADINTKLDQILETQKRMQSDISLIKDNLNAIKRTN